MSKIGLNSAKDKDLHRKLLLTNWSCFNIESLRILDPKRFSEQELRLYFHRVFVTEGLSMVDLAFVKNNATIIKFRGKI